MRDIPVYVSCKFEMYIFKIALVISENVRIAFLYVLSIYIAYSYYFTDLPRPLSNNLWIIPSQKVDWDRVTFSIRHY